MEDTKKGLSRRRLRKIAIQEKAESLQSESLEQLKALKTGSRGFNAPMIASKGEGKKRRDKKKTYKKAYKMKLKSTKQ